MLAILRSTAPPLPVLGPKTSSSSSGALGRRPGEPAGHFEIVEQVEPVGFTPVVCRLHARKTIKSRWMEVWGGFIRHQNVQQAQAEF